MHITFAQRNIYIVDIEDKSAGIQVQHLIVYNALLKKNPQTSGFYIQS